MSPWAAANPMELFMNAMLSTGGKGGGKGGGTWGHWGNGYGKKGKHAYQSWGNPGAWNAERGYQQQNSHGKTGYGKDGKKGNTWGEWVDGAWIPAAKAEAAVTGAGTAPTAEAVKGFQAHTDQVDGSRPRLHR